MLSLNATLLIQMGIFLVVMICLNFLLFRPLGRLYDRRQQAFRRLEEEADAREREKARMMGAYQQRLDDEHKQILDFRGSLHDSLTREKGAILDRARAQAEQLIQGAAAELETDMQTVRRDLRTQVKRNAEAVFQKVVGRSPKAAN